MAPIRDLAHNPGVGPDQELNRQPFVLEASAQPTEPHQPGLQYHFLYFKILALIQYYHELDSVFSNTSIWTKIAFHSFFETLFELRSNQGKCTVLDYSVSSGQASSDPYLCCLLWQF